MAITEISVSKIYVLATEPTNKVKDRFWFDTTNNLLKRYDGTSWKPISVSSDDVVVLFSGSKVSLTNYLNTQIAALAEGIDTKQDKLKYYSEVSGDTPSATISVANIKLEGKVAEGNYTTASGPYSHAEGNYTTASGMHSHAEGANTTASGSYSHAEGFRTTASGSPSHAEGAHTAASSPAQHVQGKFNIEDANNKYADIIGNGTTDDARSNAATVSWDGISWSQTDVRAGGTDQDNATYSLSALSESIDTKQDSLHTYSEESAMASDGSTSWTTVNIEAESNENTSGFINLYANSGGDHGGGRINLYAQSGQITLNAGNLIKLASNTAVINDTYIFSSTDLQITQGRYIQIYDADFYTNYNSKSIEVTKAHEQAGDTTFTIKNNTEINGNLTTQGNVSAVDITASNNINYSGSLLKDGVDVLADKQNSTDSALNTTDKTIVGAINELLASINTNVITSTEQKRITTTSTSAGIQMSTTAKACMVSINPVKTNVGAIYISTSSDTAPTINPLYPDQMPKYKFPDASQVYIWSDVNGDSVDLTIEYYG